MGDRTENGSLHATAVEDANAARKLHIEEEMQSLFRVMAAYINYPQAAERTVRRWERSYAQLPASHKAHLAHLPAKFASVRQCIRANCDFISQMLEVFELPFDIESDSSIFCAEDQAHLHHHSAAQWQQQQQQHQDGCGHEHGHEFGHGHEHAHTHPGTRWHDGSSDRSEDPRLAGSTSGGQGGGLAEDMIGIGRHADVPQQSMPLAGTTSNRPVTVAQGDGDLAELNGNGSSKVEQPGAAVSGNQHSFVHEVNGSQGIQNNSKGTAAPASSSLHSSTTDAHNTPAPDILTVASLSPATGTTAAAAPNTATATAAAASLPSTGTLPAHASHSHSHSHSHQQPLPIPHVHGPAWLPPSVYQQGVPVVDDDKVRCILRNLVRDWADEGAEERRQTYDPILRELRRKFPDRLMSDRPPSCLVPGAGLGRLALEISALGFACQGNDFSFYILVCSAFILNFPDRPRQWRIHPWLLSSSNVVRDSDQLAPVLVPDVVPGLVGVSEGFSMCAGDFVEVYSHPEHKGAWDSVATCFFIDTAKNIVQYIEVLAGLLRVGGVWVNLGPLLYHFADAYGPDGREEMSVEVSLEDVKQVAAAYGFEVEREEMVRAMYTANQQSMMHTEYTCALWTMVKRR